MNYIRLAIVLILASLILSVATSYADDETSLQPTANALQPLLDYFDRTGAEERKQKKMQEEEQDLQRYNQEQEAKRAEILRQAGLEHEQRLEQEQAKEREREEQERIYINELRARKVPINNISDAVNYYDAKSVHNIMVSPLLAPDRKVYGGVVTIDQQLDTYTILVKIENGISLLGSYPVKFEIAYAKLKLDNKTKDFGTIPLRVGGQIRFVGQYIGNEKYSTVIGSGNTMPVLRALYMDGSTQGFILPMVRPE